MQGTQELPSEELSAKEIFKRILKGEVVRIPYDTSLKDQLYNHLHVIKSREKKLFRELGLDYISASIKVSTVPHKIWIDEKLIEAPYFAFSMSSSKTRRKFTVFSIAAEPNAGDNKNAGSNKPATSTV